MGGLRTFTAVYNLWLHSLSVLMWACSRDRFSGSDGSDPASSGAWLDGRESTVCGFTPSWKWAVGSIRAMVQRDSRWLHVMATMDARYKTMRIQISR